ncbi:MAG: hypothetical protein Kow0069_21300 [Promethearchaeota archaeon]
MPAKKLWVRVANERNVFLRSRCSRCNEVRELDDVFLVVLLDDCAPGDRRVGKLQVYCRDCWQESPGPFAFQKVGSGITWIDLETLIKRYNLVVNSWGKALYVDFCVLIADYRSDVRFQGF